MLGENGICALPPDGRSKKNRGMYKSISIRVDRLARVEKLDRGLTSPANNRVFIPSYANDFVEESSRRACNLDLSI